MTYRDVVRARSASPSILNKTALLYAMGKNCAIFTNYQATASDKENAGEMWRLERKLGYMGSESKRLEARFTNNDRVIQFVCADSITIRDFVSLMDLYDQKYGVYKAGKNQRIDTGLYDKESGYIGGSDRTLSDKICQCYRNALCYTVTQLHDGSVNPSLIAYVFGQTFGETLYFNYPAQTIPQKAYELLVVQRPPVWSGSRQKQNGQLSA